MSQHHIVIEDPNIQEEIINYASLKLIIADIFPTKGRLDDWKVVQNDGGGRSIRRVCDLQDIAGESYPMKGEEISYSLGEGRWNIGEIIVEIRLSEKIFVVGHNLIPHRWVNIYGGDLEIRKFLGEVYNHANKKEHNYIKVYGPNQKGFWDYLFQNPKREVDTVFIGGKNEILADLDEFFGSERDYLYFGHPYKRNYLFHGPPGNGKTSFINAIAGKYKLNVFLISFSVNITDEVFKKLISGLNKNSLLVMEDIDVLFQSGGGGGGGGKNITMSTILNTLDGLARKNRIICVMSTNHFDVLTDVFKRPGRLDMLVEFKNADKKCFEEMAEFIVKYQEVGVGVGEGYIKMAGDFYDEIAYLNPSRALAQKFLFENRTKKINELFSSGMSKKFREMHDLFINKKDAGGGSNLYV
jgi:DNA polymerase III delta prime subunit